MINDIFQNRINADRLKDTGDFPKVVLIDTISFCNLRCAMCVHKEMTRTKGIMAWNLFTKIINEITEMDKNIRVWLVFFGEALILKKKKPTIFDMITYAKGKGLTDIVLNSNANLLDNESAIRLIESGLDAIYIGLDAFRPETYSKIRIGGDYNKVVNNVMNLIEIKKERKAEKPVIYTQFVEMDINAHEKEEFIEFWNKQGAIVKIRPKVSWAGLIKAPNLILGSEYRWPCHWAMQTMSITNTGKVVTCAVDLDARFIAGDINEETIKSVWNNRLKKLRQIHQRGEFEKLPSFCKDCRDWQAARADYYLSQKV